MNNRPRDLTDHIQGWLDATLLLAQSANMQEIATEIKKLGTRQEMSGFQLAFVGEFSRGKSLLVNRLLNRSLLPIGTLPTTAVLTSVVSGAKEQMEIVFTDGHQETRALTEDAWDDLVASDQPEQVQKRVSQVRLTIDSAWLRELDVEIIDTPGVNDLGSYRAALVTEALSQSDAAVMLVSGTFPLSLTEAEFLGQEVIGRHIPRIIVGVSMLDMLRQDQKAGVFNAAVERVAHVSQQIQVYPTYPVNEDITEEETLEAVRLQIAAIVSRSDRRAWRSQQLASLLADHLQRLIKAGQTALDAAKISAEMRTVALQKVHQEIHAAEFQWEKIVLAFEERRLQLDSLLREYLFKAQQSLTERAIVDLDNALDLIVWWERDFPLRIRQAFFQLAHDYEAWLLDSLAGEVAWLHEEVQRIFGIDMEMSTLTSRDAVKVPLNFGEIELVDVNRQRFLVRLGTSATVIIGYLLFAPIGSAVAMVNNVLDLGGAIIGSETVNLAASPLFDKKEKQQKIRLRNEVKQAVERSIEEYMRRISMRLHDLFEQVIESVKREQSIWLQSRKQMLESDDQHAVRPPWSQLLDESAKLKAEILAVLARY